MLNYLRKHICTKNIILAGLIFFLIVFRISIPKDRDEIQNRFEDIEEDGLNFLITNDLSNFSESKVIEKQAKEFLRQWNLAGMTMSVVKNGKLVYAQGFGYSDVEAKQPVTPGQLFRVASISKLITAVAILKLVEDKSITLDSKVFGP
ncbi:MAG: serine hydrolase domain-containing protein, partial [Bacteroidota bacterium]|nr:serine hydrolase domain-containing protein [Bacteroidota bacterium]